MPYQFARDTDFPNLVRKAICRLNQGLYESWTKDGIEVFMPKEINFNVLFLTQPQLIPIVTATAGTKNGTEGGTNTTVQTGTDTTVQTGTDTSLQTGTDTTAQTGTDTSVTSGATTTDDSTQTTTHGETVNTTDAGQTELQFGDVTGTDSGYLGLQSQPFPI